jgi:hypothetical protein
VPNDIKSDQYLKHYKFKIGGKQISWKPLAKIMKEEVIKATPSFILSLQH